MAISQGQQISASDFQVKTVASLSKSTGSFSVSYGNPLVVTLGTFSIPSNIYFHSYKAMCSISSSSPSTWKAPTTVIFEATPQRSSFTERCILHRSTSTGNSGQPIVRSEYSSQTGTNDYGTLSSDNPPSPILHFLMFTGGDSNYSNWQLHLNTTYTIKATISQQTSAASYYSNMVFNFKLWLY